ncbi:male-enhanced antigen 1 [Cololabis saira]|uniref:male-enhanced antigen 1 n=1 Tax=Cololabis saira TaxID=129043 RepID=UPI002AD33080|nr:male-enhanced antigen 1 [Cololabis saira]
MAVCSSSSSMGPERVFPNSEDELGGEDHPGEGGLVPGGAGWEHPGVGGVVEVEGEEEEDEEGGGGYYYQPLNQEEGGAEEQEDQGGPGGQGAPPTEPLERIQMLGLHLPEAPPPDSDEEEDPEGAAAQRSRASIPMDQDHVELVRRTMAAVALPSLVVPPWAREISDDQWKDMVELTLQSRQSAAALRLKGRGGGPPGP